MVGDIKQFIRKLRNAADALEDIVGIPVQLNVNENNKTAKAITNSLKPKRKNPWDNPSYRKRQLKNLAATRAKKQAKNK